LDRGIDPACVAVRDPPGDSLPDVIRFIAIAGMRTHQPDHRRGLLGKDDPDPVAIVNADSTSDLVLICEHAGNALPKSLGRLGLAPDVMHTHIALDVGVESIARELAHRLDAPLVVQNYSRLVYDCNRDRLSPEAIPAVSAGIPIPGNTALTETERDVRYRAIFHPYAEAVEQVFRAHPRKASFSIHSFAREYQEEIRPWQAGVLYRQDFRTAHILLSTLKERLPKAAIAYNRPYHITSRHDWYVTHCAEPRQIRHGIVEICNALIADAAGQNAWSGHLLAAIRRVLPTLG